MDTFPASMKWLLIASFLASHSPAEKDQGLFTSAQSGKRSKRRKKEAANGSVHGANAAAQGPYPFTLDRLLHIFGWLWSSYGDMTPLTAPAAGTVGLRRCG